MRETASRFFPVALLSLRRAPARAPLSRAFNHGCCTLPRWAMSEPRPKGAAAEQDSGGEPVVTVRPPFDPEEYARESESKIPLDTLPPSGKPTAPPPPNMPQYLPGLTSGTMASLGSVASDAIPTLAVAREDLEWFDLAPALRAILAQVDGVERLAIVCDRAGVELDAGMAAMHDLVRDGIVTLRR